MLEPIPCSLNPSLLLIQPILAPKIHISSFFTPLAFFFCFSTISLMLPKLCHWIASYLSTHPTCTLNSSLLLQPIPLASSTHRLAPSTHLPWSLNPSLFLPHPSLLYLHPILLVSSLSLLLPPIPLASSPHLLLPQPPPLLLLHVIPLAHQAFSSCSLNPSL